MGKNTNPTHSTAEDERWTCGEPNPSNTTGCARVEEHDGAHQAADGETWEQQAVARG